MKVKQNHNVRSFTIFEVQDGDPITVFLHDIEPGKGELTVICWGRAWSCYWGAMGRDADLVEFIKRVSVDYMVNKMIQREIITNQNTEKREERYLTFILGQVKQAVEALPSSDIYK